jgi:hypothetical protein
MNGNVCPCCGEPVTTYRRFITQADPTKPFHCGNCQAVLKRSGRVWLLVMTMTLALIATSYPLGQTLLGMNLPIPTVVFIATLWMAAWVLLVNFLSWQLIRWTSVISADRRVPAPAVPNGGDGVDTND